MVPGNDIPAATGADGAPYAGAAGATYAGPDGGTKAADAPESAGIALSVVIAGELSGTAAAMCDAVLALVGPAFMPDRLLLTKPTPPVTPGATGYCRASGLPAYLGLYCGRQSLFWNGRGE